MAQASKGTGDKAARERARLYQARLHFHDAQLARRRRDNVIAGVAGGALIVLLALTQLSYFTLGPGAPALAPKPIPSYPGLATIFPIPSAQPTP